MAGRFFLVPGGLGLIPDSSPTHHAKEKKNKNRSLLSRKSVISPRKSEEVSDQSETQWVCPRQDRC